MAFFGKARRKRIKIERLAASRNFKQDFKREKSLEAACALT
jgi:hypothetical protein